MPQTSMCDCPSSRASIAFFNERRNHMAAGRVEVVSRPIEVHRQQRDDARAVLPSVGLALHHHRFLGEAIRRIRLFRISVPEVVFAERHRCELGKRADRAHVHKLADATFASFFQKEDAHDGILVEVFSGVLEVGADAPDDRGEVHNDIGPGVVEKFSHERLLSQVVLGFPWHDNFGGISLAERVANVAYEETSPARDEDSFVGYVHYPSSCSSNTNLFCRHSGLFAHFTFNLGSEFPRCHPWHLLHLNAFSTLLARPFDSRCRFMILRFSLATLIDGWLIFPHSSENGERCFSSSSMVVFHSQPIHSHNHSVRV